MQCYFSVSDAVLHSPVVAYSDQRYEGAFGLLVRRREEHGHVGGAAGPRHPHLNRLPLQSADGNLTSSVFVLFFFLLDVPLLPSLFITNL